MGFKCPDESWELKKVRTFLMYRPSFLKKENQSITIIVLVSFHLLCVTSLEWMALKTGSTRLAMFNATSQWLAVPGIHTSEERKHINYRHSTPLPLVT